MKETYSEITDEQIESIIGDVQSLHPNWGNCMVILFPLEFVYLYT